MDHDKFLNNESITNGQNVENLPDIGDHYLVRRLDNTWHSAEIIQIRQTDESETGNGHEYYVHYEGYNRRLDEWIELSRYTETVLRNLIVFFNNIFREHL